MTFYSLLFQDAAAGDSRLASEVELHRKQEVENGSALFGERYGVTDENSPRGREKKREKEQAANAALARLLADPAYRGAYDALQDTITESRRKLDDWNRRIEERRTEIERLLNDPNNPTTAAEREALIDEDERLLRIQQDVVELRNDVDETDAAAKRGDFEDVDALNRARDDIEDRTERLAQQLAPHLEGPEEVAPTIEGTTLPTTRPTL